MAETPSERYPIELSDEMKAAVEEVVKPFRTIGMIIADQIIELGIEPHIACQIAVSALITTAARTGVVSAKGFEQREPRRDWWIEATTQDFDEALKWFEDSLGKANAEEESDR